MKNKNLQHIKSAGFKTPANYFESFDENVFNKLNSKNQLNSIKETGFKVPDNYFESFNETSLNSNFRGKESKVISLFSKRNFIYASSIAAAIVVLFFNLSIFEISPSFDNLETETVENYIIDENISSYEIAALLTDAEIEEDIIIEHSFSEDNIEAYLLENADIEVLMIE